MDINAPATGRRADDTDLYMRVLDKLLRDTEDGDVVWTSKGMETRDERDSQTFYDVYETVTPAGKLRLHGIEGHLRKMDRRGDLVSAGTSSARRGEGRLLLLKDDRWGTPFPPVPNRAFQSIVDNLLTVVRYRTGGPLAQEFARRFLGGDGSDATASPA